MHYANGRAAKVGDLVRGKGYNVKHEIIGLLIGAQPAATACNCTVAYVGVASSILSRGWINKNPTSGETGIVFPSISQDGGPLRPVPSEVGCLSGQLDAFVALDPSTGEVLPPEEAVVPVAAEASAAG